MEIKTAREARERVIHEKRIFNKLFDKDCEEILKIKYEKAKELELYCAASFFLEKMKIKKHRKNN